MLYGLFLEGLPSRCKLVGKYRQSNKCKLYIGLAPYRYVGDSPWKDPEIIQDQLLYNSRNQNISGAVLFSYKNLPHQPGNNTQMQQTIMWSTMVCKALTPTMLAIKLYQLLQLKFLVLTSYGHQDSLMKRKCPWICIVSLWH